MTTIEIIRLIFWTIILSLIVGLIVTYFKKTGKPFPWGTFVTIIMVLLIVWGTRGCKQHLKKAKVEKQARAEQRAAAAQLVATSTAATEALVLTYKGLTPCKSFVGWDYKVRTDGHPLRIKYQGCDWIDRPAEGDFNAPSTFQPGEAFFVSPDTNRPNVRVQVYKKVTIQQ